MFNNCIRIQLKLENKSHVTKQLAMKSVGIIISVPIPPHLDSVRPLLFTSAHSLLKTSIRSYKMKNDRFQYLAFIINSTRTTQVYSHSHSPCEPHRIAIAHTHFKLKPTNHATIPKQRFPVIPFMVDIPPFIYKFWTFEQTLSAVSNYYLLNAHAVCIRRTNSHSFNRARTTNAVSVNLYPNRVQRHLGYLWWANKQSGLAMARRQSNTTFDACVVTCSIEYYTHLSIRLTIWQSNGQCTVLDIIWRRIKYTFIFRWRMLLSHQWFIKGRKDIIVGARHFMCIIRQCNVWCFNIVYLVVVVNYTYINVWTCIIVSFNIDIPSQEYHFIQRYSANFFTRISLINF